MTITFTSQCRIVYTAYCIRSLEQLQGKNGEMKKFFGQFVPAGHLTKAGMKRSASV